MGTPEQAVGQPAVISARLPKRRPDVWWGGKGMHLMDKPNHPPGPGAWTLLQQRIDRAMWQQDETDAAGGTISRFLIVNAPETLTYDTFDEAEAMFEALGDG